MTKFDEEMINFANSIICTLKVDEENRSATWWIEYNDGDREPVELCTETNISDARLAEMKRLYKNQFKVTLDEDLFNV